MAVTVPTNLVESAAKMSKTRDRDLQNHCKHACTVLRTADIFHSPSLYIPPHSVSCRSDCVQTGPDLCNNTPAPDRMSRSALVVPVTIGGVVQSIGKQLPYLRDIVRPAQLPSTASPALISSAPVAVPRSPQPEGPQLEQQILHPRRSARPGKLTKINVPAYSERPNRPSNRRKSREVAQAVPTWGQVLYRVLWRKKYGRHPRTWEPREMLMADGFSDALAIVDEWVGAGRKEDFFQFVSEKYPSVAAGVSTGR
ncbi:hypothetical protein P3T76_015572 [Phytophthora citrophthora]|uniref:Uncharacterized protein n=1 Tax=Phytophthora citrophthora TaxID=4793 RepID=A0AAD9FZQ9_9STRA|nr:hypothetical protein P3T76_015572 [Phytophthora citrophthora]